MKFELLNIGIYEETVFDEVLAPLKAECFEIENIITSGKGVEYLRTGISAENTARHVLVMRERDRLRSYVSKLVDRYEEAYPHYIPSFKHTNGRLGFDYGNPWINYQAPTEYIANHQHAGVLSYVIWIRVPDTDDSTTGNFQFQYTDIIGRHRDHIIKPTEGKVLIFPSALSHCVYPFYKSEDYRISVSGNVLLDRSKRI